MELRGNLGVEEGKVNLGKHCTKCDEYFIERVTLDDFIPAEDMKDDLCFECLIVDVLLPQVAKYMDKTGADIEKLTDIIHKQRDVIHHQAETIKASEEALRHTKLLVGDLNKELEEQWTIKNTLGFLKILPRKQQKGLFIPKR